MPPVSKSSTRQSWKKKHKEWPIPLPYIYPYVGAQSTCKKNNHSIVLQNQGVIANGFVQLAPKKSEFYTTPPQQFDSQDWLNNLAVHELRHVAQFDKLTGGRHRPFPKRFTLPGSA